MANYAIGDIQGCYDPLMRLLQHIKFDPSSDRLWLVGDLVNRGPDSLKVLRFFYELSLNHQVVITLGNHDLYFLSRLFLPGVFWKSEKDTLSELLHAPDAITLAHWLRQQPFLYYDDVLKIAMTHAGLPPIWSLQQAFSYAKEIALELQSEDFRSYLKALYGNSPVLFSEELRSVERWRCITNYLTRMRFCDEKGGLIFDYAGSLEEASQDMIPWFAHPMRQPNDAIIIFGHWAALGITHPASDVYALDTGCVWGRQLTAMRLEDKTFFSVEAKG